MPSFKGRSSRFKVKIPVENLNDHVTITAGFPDFNFAIYQPVPDYDLDLKS
jgi:hypothetical protein